MSFRLRSRTVPAVALSAALLLSACGGGSGATSGSAGSGTPKTSSAPDSSTGTPASGEHNDADVAFATGMVPHHSQAVEMADLASTRASSPQVKALAEQIKAAQGPQITQMSGWLTGWGAKVPADGMGSMDMGDDTSMNGMMSETDMKSLASASGSEFDTAFLTGMVAHHRGALEMAKTEARSGANAEAKKLAQAITQSQTREITQMQTMLTKLQG